MKVSRPPAAKKILIIYATLVLGFALLNILFNILWGIFFDRKKVQPYFNVITSMRLVDLNLVYEVN